MFNKLLGRFSKDLGIDLEVKEASINNGIWEISETTASFLNSSAKPGEGGNIVIYGHNKKDILGKLIGNIKTGMEIQIFSQNGTFFRYETIEIKTVTPNEIGVVLPTDYEILTLYTCTGLLDSKRLIIKAIPI